MYNKKGLGETLMITASIIFLVFLIAVFLIYFSLDLTSDKREGTLEVAEITSADLSLLTFLRTPVETENRTLIMSDLIVESEIENDYEDFENQTLNTIGEYFNGFSSCCWSLTLEKENKFLYEIQRGCNGNELSPVAARIEIPSLTSDIGVTLTQFKEEITVGGVEFIC